MTLIQFIQVVPTIAFVLVILITFHERMLLRLQINQVAEMEQKRFDEILKFTKEMVAAVKILEARVMIIELTMGHRDYKSVVSCLDDMKNPEYFVSADSIAELTSLLEELVKYYNIPKVEIDT